MKPQPSLSPQDAHSPVASGDRNRADLRAEFRTYDRSKSYQWNYDNAPDPPDGLRAAEIPGRWKFVGLDVDSPLGVPAGPLLNGRWCLYYAALGFDVVTYKTVRSSARACYDLPNLQPVRCGTLSGREADLPGTDEMTGSWAVSFGMPSTDPVRWQDDVRWTRDNLGPGKLLSVSVVGTVQEGWSLERLADDYAQCAVWAKESGADCIESNFSCPNVSTCDGQLYQHPQDAAVVAARVRAAIGRQTPYVAKIGRIESTGDAVALIEALADSVDALAMTNSIASTVRSADGTRLFGGERRGICGTATLDTSVAQVATLSRLIADRKLPLELIGVGGAGSAEHVRRYLDAGAHAVHMATSAMVDPQVALRIRDAWQPAERR